MKRRTAILVLILLMTMAFPARAEEITAKAAILYHPDTDTVLFEQLADEPMLIASTTKIMTALLVLEHCAMDEIVVVPDSCEGIEGSSMYLKAGDRHTVEQLLYGMMLSSANDAAAALACYVSGSLEEFAGLMNEKARALGLNNSHFANPHGLDAPEHYSTARDLALLTAAAMEDPDFCRIFSTETYQSGAILHRNHNKLLRYYPGCTGGKTGYTKKAGRVLVSSCERDGMALICVTICAPNDWSDHMQLYDDAYATLAYVPALEQPASIEVISGTKARVELQAGGVLVDKQAVIRRELFLPDFVFASVTMGQRAGEVHLYADEEKIVLPVTYAQTVMIDGSIPLTPWERFRRAWELSSRYGVYY